MSNTCAKSIVYYTGHCEIVGGDAKYLFDLVNILDSTKFNLKIYTEKNLLFEKRAGQWLKVPISIEYLDTRPKLFELSLYDKITNNAFNNKFVKYCFSRKIAGRELFWYISVLYRTLTFKSIRDDFYNVIIFYKFFKNNKDQIDIFHFNNGGYPGKDAGLVAVIMAKIFNIDKIIMSIHNEPPRRSLKHPLYYIYDYLVAKCCDKVITASKVLEKKLAEYRGFPPNKIKTLYCGLDDENPISDDEIRKYKQNLGIDEGCFILLISGNIQEDRKGHVPLFHALVDVKRKYNNIKLLVVGDGTDDRKKYLNDIVKDLELKDNVIFLGYRTDIHELNCIADIAIVPSLANEATPYTIKEAARAGTPVITTFSGGCSEAVDNQISGLLVNPGNTIELSEAIVKLLDNAELRSRIGRAARENFLNRFLLSTIAKEHEYIYLFK